MRFLKHYSFTR